MLGNYSPGPAQAGTSQQWDSFPPTPPEASGFWTPQESQGINDQPAGMAVDDKPCPSPGGSGPSFEVKGDDNKRRLIRHQYRKLIHQVQWRREDMLSSKSNKLTDALEQANHLFHRVSQAREAVLDAQFLVLASDLGKEKANQLHSDMTVFDPASYTEDLLKYMGLNCLEEQESDGEEEPLLFGFLFQDSWLRVGVIAIKFLKCAPSFHFLFGSFKTDPPVPKQRNERQRRKVKERKERAMPAKLKKMEEDQQEATEKEVERILGLLQTYFREEPETPISFFDFVIDPNSFARTVENIFHVSFIVRDGFARIRLDQDKLPIIEPVTQGNEENEQGTQIQHQDIIPLSYQDWKNIVRTFEISQPMISPLSCSK